MLQEVVTKTFSASVPSLHEEGAFKKNVLKVLVFYDDLNFKQIEESPAYSVRYLTLLTSWLAGNFGIF